MTLYRVAYAVMWTIGFVVKACVITFFVGFIGIVLVGAWQRADSMAWLPALGAVIAAAAFMGLIFGWFMLFDWLRRKAWNR